MQTTAGPLDLIIFASLAFGLLGAFVFLLLRSYLNVASFGKDSAAAIYDSQLDEIEKDLALGTIDESEFNNAKNEILRRLLKSQKQVKNTHLTEPKKQVPFALAGAAVLATLGVYLLIGSPFRKDEPLAQRAKAIFASDMSKLSSDEIMLVLQEKAKSSPKDDEPHLFMGKILMDKGQADDALQSFQAALRRNPKNPEAMAEFAGAILELNGAKMDEEFNAAIDAALKLDPQNQSARFYLGKALWLNEKKPEGLNEWRDIYEKIKNDEAAKNGFILRLVSNLSRLDIGPKAEAMDQDTAQFGTPEFINSMIARRAEKLNANPTDIGLRLSYANVISKSDSAKALGILEAGRPYFANDAMQKDILEMTILIQTNMGEKK